jgi:hypothetical protein
VCVRERTFEDKSGLVPTDSVRREEGLKRGIDIRKGTGEVALSFAELMAVLDKSIGSWVQPLASAIDGSTKHCRIGLRIFPE